MDLKNLSIEEVAKLEDTPGRAVVAKIMAMQDKKHAKSCPFCDADMSNATPEIFKDELSWREFKITGQCQKCQDVFFDHP